MINCFTDPNVLQIVFWSVRIKNQLKKYRIMYQITFAITPQATAKKISFIILNLL